MNELKQQLKELEVEHIFKQERIKNELEHEIKQTLGLDCSYISTTPCNINGVPVSLTETQVRWLQVKANFLYKNGKWRLEIQYVGKGKYFNTSEQAQMYCDLIIVEEDGTERIEKSAASRMLLNDEQKEAIQAIKTAIEDAKKKGVILLFDRECDDIYAFSEKEMKKWDIDCRGYKNTEERVDYTDLLEDTGMSIYSSCFCDCGIYVEWKK